jgi:hypothetical protein
MHACAAGYAILFICPSYHQYSCCTLAMAGDSVCFSLHPCNGVLGIPRPQKKFRIIYMLQVPFVNKNKQILSPKIFCSLFWPQMFGDGFYIYSKFVQACSACNSFYASWQIKIIFFNVSGPTTFKF